MLIIGCDFHTRYQHIAMMDTDTGESVEQRLEHENGEANAFYRSLAGGRALIPKNAFGWPMKIGDECRVAGGENRVGSFAGLKTHPPDLKRL